jgi:small subunit ribosomal protein S12
MKKKGNKLINRKKAQTGGVGRRKINLKQKLIRKMSRPQQRATIIKILTMKPKKPNSALRKVAKVKLNNNNKIIYAYIPGEGHSLILHNQVLIRNGCINDLPGVNHTIIRGVYDASPVLNRKKSRSKYGVKKIK